MSNTRAATMASLVGFIALALPEIGANKVKIEERGSVNQPPPAFPYISISWEQDLQTTSTPHVIIDTPVSEDEDSLYYKDVYQRRKAVVKISIFTKLTNDIGFDYLSELLLSLNRQEIKTYLDGKDISITEAGSIIDTTSLRTSKWEPSCSCDLYVNYIRKDRSEIGIIESVETTIITV